ncbi:MAG: S8 family serine peptidase [Clostridia bacterium]|nr:S8 family serine peptidase [Clostridia bacterium]
MKLRIISVVLILALLPVPAAADEDALLTFFDAVSSVAGGEISLMSVQDTQSARLMVEFSCETDYPFNAQTVIKHPFENYYVVQYSSYDEALAAQAALLSDSRVNYAEFDEPVTLDYTLSGEISSVSDISWGVEYTNAVSYMRFLSDNGRDNSVVVAVVDTGADMDHPYYLSRLVSGYDIINGDNTPDDTYGHGTHVAGIVRQMTNSNTKIMPIKTFNGREASLAIIANGLEYAIEKGADIVNMSFGGSHLSSGRLETLVGRAKRNNIPVVAAAGNYATNAADTCPAHIGNCITVTAHTQSGTPCYSFSNYGTVCDISAPGEQIYSSYLNGQYTYMSGTSMATPFVSGACALLLSNSPDLSFQTLTTALLDMYALPDDWDTNYGAGVLSLRPYDWSIESLELSSSNRATVTVRGNLVCDGYEPTLFVALYDDDGIMTYFKTAELTQDKKKYYFSLGDVKGSEIKAFVWDISSASILTEPYIKST